jgi:hypothetical protein
LSVIISGWSFLSPACEKDAASGKVQDVASVATLGGSVPGGSWPVEAPSEVEASGAPRPEIIILSVHWDSGPVSHVSDPALLCSRPTRPCPRCDLFESPDGARHLEEAGLRCRWGLRHPARLWHAPRRDQIPLGDVHDADVRRPWCSDIQVGSTRQGPLRPYR